MSTILYSQEKTFKDVANLLKVSVKLIQCSQVSFVWDTNNANLILNKLENTKRIKSFVAKTFLPLMFTLLKSSLAN